MTKPITSSDSRQSKITKSTILTNNVITQDNDDDNNDDDRIGLQKQPPLFCDLCWGLDGKLGRILQTCQSCGVSVHKECYGIEHKNKKNKKKKNDTTNCYNFTCWACLAVGTFVKVRERDPISQQRIQYNISSRPTECMLCSVDDGNQWYHAMHPIYDDYGKNGRQMVLPAVGDKPKRLAWAHTLCCYTINSIDSPTTGCVYGCNQAGEYDGDDDGIDIDEGNDENDGQGDDDDNSSVNSTLRSTKNDRSVHHFVYALPDRKTGQHTAYSTRIKEYQGLTCTICRRSDKPSTSFRIPRKLYTKSKEGNQNIYAYLFLNSHCE
jgi:PHD-finger